MVAAVAQCTLPPAPATSVDDLQAGDWQHRNRAAAELATSRPAAARLLAILADGSDRYEPPPAGPGWPLGGGSGLDRVLDLERRLRDVVALPPQRAAAPRILRTAKDLVVPFTPRQLALWLAGESGVDPGLLAAGSATLLRTGTWAEQVAAADRLWQLGQAAAPQRRAAWGDPRTAAPLAHTAALHAGLAGAELAAALALPDSPAKTAILEQLRAADCAATPALAAALLSCYLDAEPANSRLAGRQYLDAGLGVLPELLTACDDPRRRARAVALLLRLGPAARPAGEKLLAIFIDDAVDGASRSLAALSLAAIGADAELAERTAQAILQRLEKWTVRPLIGEALLLALGGLRAGLPADLPARLADLTRRPAAHSPLASFHALVRLGAADRLTDAQLLRIAGRDGAGWSVARAVIARGAAGLGVLVPLLEKGVWADDFAAAIAIHLAPEARRWLGGSSTRLQLAGARGLAHLGARAGVDESVLRGLLANDDRELRRQAARILAQQIGGADVLDQAAAVLGKGPELLGLLLESRLVEAERQARVLALLRDGPTWWWHHEVLSDDVRHTVAVTLLAADPHHQGALAALARVGAREAREREWLAAALRERPTPALLAGLAEGPPLPSDWLPAVQSLVREQGDAEELRLAASAIECLWRHR